MHNSFRIGSLFGISIRIHYSWIIIFVLLSVGLIGMFAVQFPDLSRLWLVATGLVSSLLFFSSILFHEMAHSLLAKHRGQKVEAITLFVFGGVSEFKKEPPDARSEVLIAVVGPVSSWLLGGLFAFTWYVTKGDFTIVAAVSKWMATVNIVLGTFNILPGLPLDGGRILRGLIWQRTKDYARATRISSNMGKMIGFALVLFGVMVILQDRNWGGGLWLGLIGFFLVNAAEASDWQAKIHLSFSEIKANQIMSSDYQFVPAYLSIAEFISKHLIFSGSRCFIIGDSNSPVGILNAEDIHHIPHSEWIRTSVQCVMHSLDEALSVAPDSNVEEIIGILETNRVSEVAVMQNKKLLGIIDNEHLFRLLRNRLEFSA